MHQEFNYTLMSLVCTLHSPNTIALYYTYGSHKWLQCSQPAANKLSVLRAIEVSVVEPFVFLFAKKQTDQELNKTRC